MMTREEIESDLRQVRQLVDHPGWAIVKKRLTWGIEEFIERLLVSSITLDQAQGFRQRVLAYRELLDLPALLEQQSKDASASEGESENGPVA